MSILFDFVRSISAFLILQAFIRLLVPSAKYEAYIDFIMGLVLIGMTLNPITEVLTKPLDGILPNIELSLGRVSSPSINEYYAQQQNRMILDQYKNELEKRFSSLLPHGYLIDSCEIEVDDDNENFGAVISINAVLSKAETKGGRIIKVERVRVGENIPSLGDADDAEIKNIKNAVSGFYNLSVDNIHITVQKNSQK